MKAYVLFFLLFLFLLVKPKVFFAQIDHNPEEINRLIRQSYYIIDFINRRDVESFKTAFFNNELFLLMSKPSPSISENALKSFYNYGQELLHTYGMPPMSNVDYEINKKPINYYRGLYFDTMYFIQISLKYDTCDCGFYFTYWGDNDNYTLSKLWTSRIISEEEQKVIRAAIHNLLDSLGPIQNVPESTESIQAPINKTSKKKIRKSDFFLLGLGNDIWTDTPGDVSIRGYSPSLMLAGMYEAPLGYSRFSIAAGLGFQSNNLYSDSYISSFETNGKMSFSAFPDSIEVSKYKLNATYLELPVEVRLRLGEFHNVTLAMGITLGYLVHNHTKYKGDKFLWSKFSDNRQVKIKEYNIPGLTSFRYAATLRVTSNEAKLGVFARYNLKPLFEENVLVDNTGKAYNMTLITAGVLVSIY